MSIIVSVIIIAAAFASGCLYAAKRKVSREEKRQAYTRAESARDAHYMRNFWNYDGGEQEEYQE